MPVIDISLFALQTYFNTFSVLGSNVIFYNLHFNHILKTETGSLSWDYTKSRLKNTALISILFAVHTSQAVVGTVQNTVWDEEKHQTQELWREKKNKS